MGKNRAPIRRFGTFNGVFVPTILSIFGVILFLRLGWIVGNAGLINALFIIVLAVSISLATALSLSAVSTNREVGVGGVYNIISRSLGLDIGGAIGIPLYFSQAISAAFYIIGFTESLTGIFPDMNTKIIAFLILIIFSLIAFIGADFAVKIQIGIFGILIMSIFSFLIAPSWSPLKMNLSPHYMSGQSFWSVFAIFFPAVTGITAGISMSGELKNPQKNIPRGTLLAIAVSFLVYVAIACKLTAVTSFEVLQKDKLVMVHRSLFPPLVYAGIWAATLSSALTFVVGAPRTLQALAMDRVVPSILAHPLGSGKNEPRAGIILSFVIASLFIYAGTLNGVATIISMFFLLTYTITNLAQGLSALVGNPSYRPTFRVHWMISFAGAAASYSVMFLIDTPSTIVASVLIALIYVFLKRRELNQTWGDIKSGFWTSLARFALLKLDQYELDPENWRPNIMVFSGDPAERPYLVKLANWLSRGNGIVTLFNILRGDVEELHKERFKKLNELRGFILQNKLPIFPEVEIINESVEGISAIVQAHGIGQLYSNVVLFGWGTDSEKKITLARLARNLVLLKKDFLILKYDKTREFGNYKTIDIWWGGKGGNGSLMLLLAYILKLNDEWRNAKVRILKVVADESLREDAFRRITELMESARIEAEPVILVRENPGESVVGLLSEFSVLSDLTIIGMGLPLRGREEKFVERVDSLVSPLGTVLLVRSVNVKELI